MIVRAAFAALVTLLMPPATALAADSSGMASAEPYVIEKVCSEGKFGCTVRMVYPTGSSAMVVRPGSYWYAKPSRQGVLTVRR